MMSRYSIAMVSLMILIFISSTQSWATDSWTGNVNFTLGAKALDEDDWEPVDEHTEVGIHVDFRKQDWPVNIAISLLASVSEEEYVAGYKVESSTSELRFGIKKIWEPTPTMRPFLGIGLGLINAELDIEGYDIDDSTLGFWLTGGIYWTINNSFNLGFELGFSQGEVEAEGYDANAGGGHAALLLGYHW